MSDFHTEKWNPCWTAGTILIGLCSFMSEEYGSRHGSLYETSDKRKKLAKQSGSYDMEHFPKFNELFPGKTLTLFTLKSILLKFSNIFLDMVFEILNRSEKSK